MLAVEAKEPFDSDDHLFEIKWDGIRCLAFIEAGRVRLQSRERIKSSFLSRKLWYRASFVNELP